MTAEPVAFGGQTFNVTLSVENASDVERCITANDKFSVKLSDSPRVDVSQATPESICIPAGESEIFQLRFGKPVSAHMESLGLLLETGGRISVDLPESGLQ